MLKDCLDLISRRCYSSTSHNPDGSAGNYVGMATADHMYANVNASSPVHSAQSHSGVSAAPAAGDHSSFADPVCSAGPSVPNNWAIGAATVAPHCISEPLQTDLVMDCAASDSLVQSRTGVFAASPTAPDVQPDTVESSNAEDTAPRGSRALPSTWCGAACSRTSQAARAAWDSSGDSGVPNSRSFWGATVGPACDFHTGFCTAAFRPLSIGAASGGGS